MVTETVPPYTVAAFHCVATLSLGRGQITLQGLVEVQGEDDPGPFPWPSRAGRAPIAELAAKP